MSSYIGVELEKRIDDKSHKASYNIFEDANETKENFFNREINSGHKYEKKGKSHNKDTWDVTQIDGDQRKESKEPYNSFKMDNIFSDFHVDVNPMFDTGDKKSTSVKTAKDMVIRKPSKKPAKKPAKTSTKKGGRSKKKRSKK